MTIFASRKSIFAGLYFLSCVIPYVALLLVQRPNTMATGLFLTFIGSGYGLVNIVAGIILLATIVEPKALLIAIGCGLLVGGILPFCFLIFAM